MMPVNNERASLSRNFFGRRLRCLVETPFVGIICQLGCRFVGFFPGSRGDTIRDAAVFSPSRGHSFVRKFRLLSFGVKRRCISRNRFPWISILHETLWDALEV